MKPLAALGFVGGLALALSLPFLLAQTGPAGGLPSRPRFETVGVGQAAPSTTGAVTASGTIESQGSTSFRATSATAPRVCFDDTDAATDERGYLINNSTGLFRIWLTQDSNVCSPSGGTIAFEINRTGLTADSIDLAATSVTVNGAAIPTVLTAYKTAEESVTSSITLQDDDALTITTPASPAGTAYHVSFHVGWNQNGSTANGIRMRPVGSAGGLVRDPYCMTTTDTTATATAPVAQSDAADLVHTMASAGLNQVATCEATLEETDTNGSTITLQWAQATSNATATRVMIGSNVRAVRLN